MEFNNKRNYDDILNTGMLSLEGHLTDEDTTRLQRIKRAWNFYEGYHWEEVPMSDKPQITENYCRAFVNKFVAFELGKGFTTKYSDVMIGKKVNDIDTLEDYMKKVWDYNLQDQFSVELGQSKSITGDSWVQVRFYSPEELVDPFEEHPDGMIRVMVIPTNVAFPEYDVHDKSKLVKLTMMYPIEVEDTSLIMKRTKIKKVVYKQIWTKDRVEEYIGKDLKSKGENKYGIIPFVQIKNFPVVGKTEGTSDIEDLIPLNVELNMKKSDISEIIDYHSAPVTVVFGAKVSALEKGANKIWGGLPKDAKVQNLELNSDLRASVDYVGGLKMAMHEIGGVPTGALGGTQAISNTSGVALQFINMPLIERTRVKKMCTQSGLEQVTKLILLISFMEKLIIKPEEVSGYDFFYSEVKLPDTLPKDTLIELQELESEMRMHLESRTGALERLGRDDIEKKIAEIDKDFRESPEAYGQQPQDPTLNSGMTNGSTSMEKLRKENNGANMPQ